VAYAPRDTRGARTMTDRSPTIPIPALLPATVDPTVAGLRFDRIGHRAWDRGTVAVRSAAAA